MKTKHIWCEERRKIGGGPRRRRMMPTDPDGGSLSSGQADAGAMLEEERAPSLAQVFVRRLMIPPFVY